MVKKGFPQFSITIRPDLRDRIDKAAKRDATTTAAWIRQAVVKELERRGM